MEAPPVASRCISSLHPEELRSFSASPPSSLLFLRCNRRKNRAFRFKSSKNLSIHASSSGDSVVTLLDYGAGNVRSVRNAIRFLGFDIKDVQAPEDILNAERLIFPGVGAFAPAMDVFNRKGLAEALRIYIENDRPFLGICLGLQLLFESSEENGPVDGLGLIPGVVGRFDSSNGFRVPHIGWNALQITKDSEILDDISNQHVYFVHSYRAMPSDENKEWVSSTCNYGDKFIASVRRGNVHAVQFHPEKSGDVGLSVLRRFLYSKSNITKAVAQYERVGEYLKIIDAYVDMILQNKMENILKTILEGILQQASHGGIAENELPSLQSILLKLLSQYHELEDLFGLDHFLEILDLLSGNPRSIVSIQILHMAARNGSICNPRTIQLLFEISQELHDAIDFVNVKDDDNQAARLISHFIREVDFGAEIERHLTFLVECRGAFGNIDELKETLVHSSNCVAIKALKDAKKHNALLKSCIAFSEVTLPAVSIEIRKINLYIETAEAPLKALILPVLSFLEPRYLRATDSSLNHFVSCH